MWLLHVYYTGCAFWSRVSIGMPAQQPMCRMSVRVCNAQHEVLKKSNGQRNAILVWPASLRPAASRGFGRDVIGVALNPSARGENLVILKTLIIQLPTASSLAAACVRKCRRIEGAEWLDDFRLSPKQAQSVRLCGVRRCFCSKACFETTYKPIYTAFIWTFNLRRRRNVQHFYSKVAREALALYSVPPDNGFVFWSPQRNATFKWSARYAHYKL